MSAPAPQYTLRDLTSLDDQDQCVALQKITWGEHFNQAVPHAILRISLEMGGVAAGAFDPSGRMLGFVFGISGPRNGRVEHWSDMLAVLPELRSSGLGRDLKAYQRQKLLAAGIDTCYWTFDPLMAKNANFNFNRLGARVAEYRTNLYGENTGSDLHSGLGTDRFVALWRLNDARVETALASGMHPDPAAFANVPVANPGAEMPSSAPSDPQIRIQIPADVQRLKQNDPQGAVRWRESSRAAFRTALNAGFEVDAFYRDGDSGYYVLTHAERP